MPPRPLVHLIEDALDARTFAALRRSVIALGRERLRDTYQTTFWFPLDGRPPTCLPELAALKLWPRLPAATRKKVLGAEWWLSRMRTHDVRVDFHQDRDERLANERGQIVHPVRSSVFFLNRVKGGALAVTREPADDENPSRAPARFEPDLVGPRPNRFVHFAGDLTHGVLDRDNQIPDTRRISRGALRLALILNWWDRRPYGIPAFSEVRYYRALKLP